MASDSNSVQPMLHVGRERSFTWLVMVLPDSQVDVPLSDAGTNHCDHFGPVRPLERK